MFLAKIVDTERYKESRVEVIIAAMELSAKAEAKLGQLSLMIQGSEFKVSISDSIFTSAIGQNGAKMRPK